MFAPLRRSSLLSQARPPLGARGTDRLDHQMPDTQGRDSQRDGAQ